MLNFVNNGTDDAILKSLPIENCSEDLVKAMSKQGLVQKEVTVQGKNGKVFTRKQWVKASDTKNTNSDLSPTLQDFMKASDEGEADAGKTSRNPKKVVDAVKTQYIEAIYQKGQGLSDSQSTKLCKKLSKQCGVSEIDVQYEMSKQFQEWYTKSTPKSKATPTAERKIDLSFDKPADGDTKGAISQMLSSGKSRQDIMTAAKAAGISWKESEHEGINWMRASMAIQKHMNESKSTPTVTATNTGDNKSVRTNTGDLQYKGQTISKTRKHGETYYKVSGK